VRVVPGFLFAIFLCAFKSYFQVVVFMRAVVYATSMEDFLIMVFFTVVSLIVGHFCAAASA
jgi:hypothetical protein